MKTRPAIRNPALLVGGARRSDLSTGRRRTDCRAKSDCEHREDEKCRCGPERSLIDTCLALGSGSTHELNPRPG